METPSYEAVVNTYDIEVLKSGGDLQVTSLTKDGDLKLGDDRFNAMFRFVQRWRFNSPTLTALFEGVVTSRDRKRHLVGQRNQVVAAIRETTPAEQLHALNDEIAANEFGPAAYAGAIVLVLNNLLQRFKSDLDVHDEIWKKAYPLIEGCSVGSIVEAAANNFRHHDEWARSEPPTRQQLPSILTVAAILKRPIASDGSRHPFRQNVCPEIIEALSGGDYERLNHKVFTFANSIVSGKVDNYCCRD
jgi:hypothetical protein